MRRPTSRPLLPFLAGLLIGGVAVSILLQRPETERDTQKLQVQLSSAMRELRDARAVAAASAATAATAVENAAARAAASTAAAATTAAAAVPKPVNGPEQRCSHLKKTYGVQPGMSWGSLTADGKAEWAQLGCDDKLPSNDGEPAPTRSEQPGRWWAALPMNGPDSSANGSTSADVYEPSWGSLLRYEGPPEWYRDAKLGIFFHWGVRRARAAPAPA